MDFQTLESEENLTLSLVTYDEALESESCLVEISIPK
jgi:hypothetical protein